jgi:hypothetical protein
VSGSQVADLERNGRFLGFVIERRPSEGGAFLPNELIPIPVAPATL